MVEYKIGETAHVNRRITVKAQKSNIIKSLTIAMDAAVGIIAVRKSMDTVAIKATGGAVYDILYEGYKIDSIPQKDLYSKSQWAKISELLAKLKKQ